MSTATSSREGLPDLPAGMAFLLFTAFLTISLIGLHYISSVFAPAFLGLTLVLAFRPLGRFFIKHGLPPWLAIIFMFISIVVTFVGTVAIIVWSLVPVPQALMSYSDEFEKTLDTVLTFLNSQDISTDIVDKYLKDIDYNALISPALKVLSSLSSAGGLITVVIMVIFFITLDTITMSERNIVTRLSHSDLAISLSAFEKRVRNYWIICTVFGLVVAIVDAAALQMMAIPLAWTWGMWAFITNYIPNVGFILGVVPPMIMGLFDQGWQTMLWILVLYSVINIVIQTFIQPKFIGDIVGLSPTVTFISLILWTSVVGLLGSILAIPLTLFFKALLVDSDPRTRWLDVFLISEKDTKQKFAEGWYDAEHSEEESVPDITNPLASLDGVSVLNFTKAKLQRLKARTKGEPVVNQLVEQEEVLEVE